MEARDTRHAESAARSVALLQEANVNKWGKLLKLVMNQKAFENPIHRRQVATLIENTSRYLQESDSPTTTSNIATFTKMIFPIIARLVPNLIAQQLVFTQPMTGPTGSLFYYEGKHVDDKGNGGVALAGTNLYETFSRYYSSEFVDYEIKVAGAAVDGVKTAWTDGANATERVPFKFLPLQAKNAAKGVVITVYYTFGAGLKTLTDNGAGVLLDVDGVQRGTVTYSTGAFTLSLAHAPDAATPIYASYSYDSEGIRGATAPGVTTALYASANQVAKVPEIRLELTSEAIQANTRKMKATWTVEAQEDLKAIHGIDGEAALVAQFSSLMGLEIDQEILNDLIVGAQYSATYEFEGSFNGANLTHNALDQIRQLLTTIGAVSAAIHKGSGRSPANFIVTSPAVVSLLSQLDTHGEFRGSISNVTEPSMEGGILDFGIKQVGVLKNQFTVYQDPYMTETQILVGRRPSGWLDVGYAYCPYIPMQLTEPFQDPNTFSSVRGIRTRYAKKLVAPKHYGLITVAGLPTVTG